MKTPKVLIVTPSLNRVALIEATIESVLKQTYKNIEYIVVDGGSIDGTLEILEKYSKEGKLKYISEPDKGMYDAINKGFNMSDGDILAYLNTDDMYFPWTVSVAVEALQTRHVDILCGDTLVQDGNGKTIRINLWPPVNEEFLKAGYFIAQPTAFLKKQVFLDVGNFGKEMKFLGDCEYWLRAVESNFRIANVHELLAIECNHEDTIRNKYKFELEEEKKQLKNLYRSRFTHPQLSKVYRTIKFVQSEILYLWFRILISQTPRSGSAWHNFRASFQCQFNLINYYLSKLRLANLYDDLWQIEEKVDHRS
jgi:glycosyltransferase involved in cell wall biosynthesis